MLTYSFSVTLKRGPWGSHTCISDDVSNHILGPNTVSADWDQCVLENLCFQIWEKESR